MKKLFIPFLLCVFYTTKAQTVISYSTIPFEIDFGASVSCNGDTETTGNAFSWDNKVSRSFKLHDFDIYGNFLVHKVSFGVQNVLSLPQDGYPATVNLYTSEGDYPYGELTLIGTAETVITQANSHTVEVPLEATVPAGSELVMEIHYNGESIMSVLYIGANAANDDQPAYIQAEVCGVPTPVEVANIGAPDSKWLMSIEGEEEFLGTNNALASSEISVYPNPVTEYFNINNENSNEKISQIQLFDLNGNKVKSYGTQVDNLDVSGLAKGVYLIKIHTVSGKVFTQKLIKK